jgi:hypothetical protein
VSGPVTSIGGASGAVTAPEPPRPATAIFDINIDLAEPDAMLATIARWAAAGLTRRVMYVNAHVVNQTRASPELLATATGYGSPPMCSTSPSRTA